MRTVAFCEIDPYCRAVLAKRWPGVPVHGDVRQLRGSEIRPVDLICGGFPCQDISFAGKGAGLSGERSGLWREYHRLISEIRPAWVVAENVSALRTRGLDQVLGSLDALGYDAEWHCIPASAVGAPHRRDRIWIVAYPNGIGAHGGGSCRTGRTESSDGGAAVADSNGPRLEGRDGGILQERPGEQPARESGPLPDADNEVQSNVPVHAGPRLRLPELERYGRDAWSTEPDVGRVADGVPSRVHRLRALGNSVVPQVVQAIGEAIMSAEAA
jgi:DNA (cytosine-5)-methyltransferase 1